MAIEIEPQGSERDIKKLDDDIIGVQSEDRLVNMLMVLRCDIEDAIRREERWIKEGKNEDILQWDQGAKTMLEVVLKELDFILEDNGYL